MDVSVILIVGTLLIWLVPARSIFAWLTLPDPSSIKIPTRQQLRSMCSNCSYLNGFGAYNAAQAAGDKDLALRLLLEARGVERDIAWSKVRSLPEGPSQSFNSFGKLPSELRAQIWRHSVKEGRIIEVNLRPPTKSGLDLPWRWTAARPSRFTPGQMGACRESREIASWVYCWCFGTWFNIYNDTIWINSLFRSALGWNYTSLIESLSVARLRHQDSNKEQEESNRALYRIPRLMITWQLVDNEALTLLETHLPQFWNDLGHLEELILIVPEYIYNRRGVSYLDDRILKEEDLEELSGDKNLGLRRSIEPKVQNWRSMVLRKNLSTTIQIKLLQKGEYRSRAARDHIDLEEIQ